MKTTPEHIIKLSKLKLTLMFLGSLGFVTLGVFFMINPEQYTKPWMRSEEVVFAAGLASILFFGMVGAFIGLKLFDSRPGLILTNEGLFDNTSALSVGFVKWEDIQEIRTKRMSKTFFLIVRNPEHYIKQQPSKFKQRVMKLNLKSYGSPLALTSNGLQCGFQDLHDLIQAELEKYNSRTK